MAENNNNLRWLVTGGCGFIGTSLVNHLVENELAGSIRILDNLSVGEKKVSTTAKRFSDHATNTSANGPIIEFVQGDIREPEVCNACCEGMDIVIHLAANTGVPESVKNPRKDMDVNVIGTFNMLEAARNNSLGRFVFASSGAPAGEVEPPIHEELPPHPVSPYGASKLAGEGYCSAYFKTFGLETVVLRFSNVYGPGSTYKNSVVAKFIKQAIKGEDLRIYGDGSQTRDFLYIDDLIRAIVLSAKKEGIGGETFQIATNTETSLDEMVGMLLSVFDHFGIERPRIVRTAPRLGDVKRNYSDTTKALAKLAWKSEKDLRAGLKRTVSFFM